MVAVAGNGGIAGNPDNDRRHPQLRAKHGIKQPDIGSGMADSETFPVSEPFVDVGFGN
jgi:hypothetical protein